MPTKSNKTDAVRKILKKNPNARPAEVAAQVKQNCTANFVSSVRYQMKKGGEINYESRGPRAGAPTGKTKRGRGKAAFDKVSLESIRQAKEFVDKAGGIEEAIDLLDAIEVTGGVTKTRAALEAVKVFI